MGCVCSAPRNPLLMAPGGLRHPVLGSARLEGRGTRGMGLGDSGGDGWRLPHRFCFVLPHSRFNGTFRALHFTVQLSGSEVAMDTEPFSNSSRS